MQSIILLLGLFADAISAGPLAQQQPLADQGSPTPAGQVLAESSRRPVNGRFLHITGKGGSPAAPSVEFVC